MSSRQQSAPQPHLFKFIIIGDTEVGKSSLMLMFTEQHFQTVHDLTIGVEFDSRSITLADGSTAMLEIWDTAGQESYLSITRSYYRGTDCCLLVYDVSRRESFENLPRWLNEAKQNAANQNLVLMLVANKADLDAKRQVTTAEGQAFADSHAMLFTELSAKHQKKVEDVFASSAQRILAMQRANPIAKGAVVKLQPNQQKSDALGDCGCG
ncbi:ras family-domain-containing protein [Pelagophyceae sp. CCMP2097]|nr:ras family-domain-containing protein [Pelagophyceae sp. CCMP2097]